MAEIKVEDLMQSIREGAREGAAHSSEATLSSRGSNAKHLGRLETSLTITARAQDQLPPVTTYRSGLAARLELWIKRLLKRATNWFTWEQVNFNSATHSALQHALVLLQTYDQRVTSLQKEVNASVTAKAELSGRLAQLEEKIAEIHLAHRQRIESLLHEQRVCFKQLALELSETGVIADRAKRSMQLRLEELANRLDQIDAQQRRLNSVGSEASEKREGL